jgi:pimeloyl-ACP methyl ester carboxylesterase
MQQKSIHYQNATISYRIVGKGKTVMLLHGFGEDGTVWENQIEALKEYYSLLIPDIPGSGNAGYLPDANIDTYAQILKAIIDIELPETEENFSLIGHSMGGYIALAFAEKFPLLLNSFGLFHSSAFEDSEEKKLVRIKAIEFIKEKGAFTFLKTSIPTLFNEQYAADNAAYIDGLIEKSKAFTSAALVQYYQAMIDRPERIEVLNTFPNPILFIIGEFDKAIPLESSLAQCYLPAISHVNILAKSAHMGMFEEPLKANKYLLDFLEKV